MTHYIGFDAGGSHCRSRLIDADGKVLGTGEAGPANTRIGVDLVHEQLTDVTMQALSNAGLDSTILRHTHAGLGIAGLSRPGTRDALEAIDFPFASMAFDNDAAIANLGAHAGDDGAVLILGTGSIAFIQVAGERSTIGGYGFPISDEASGAALGLSAMRHALRALDGRTKPTPLSTAVTVRFDHDTRQAVAWMDRAAPKDYGGLAPLVMQHAEAGDEIALSIVLDAVRHIEKFIETIFARGAPRCAMMGGLSSRMRPWLRARTSARLVQARGDGLDGALHLAGYRPTSAPG